MIAITLVWKDELRHAQVFSENNCVSLALLLSTAERLFPDLRKDGKVGCCLDDAVMASNEELQAITSKIIHENEVKLIQFTVREDPSARATLTTPVWTLL